MAETTLAAVDIGTNSVKMVLGKGDAIVLDTVKVTRLGEGVEEGFASGLLARRRAGCRVT